MIGKPAGAIEYGAIKWFDPTKGYGFIRSDAEDDVFLHISVVRRCGMMLLQNFMRVGFVRVQRGANGWMASEISCARGDEALRKRLVSRSAELREDGFASDADLMASAAAVLGAIQAAP